MRTTDQGNQRRRARTLGCIGVTLGAPILFTAVLLVVWAVNNRPPRIEFPKREMPVVNAADDFHRAFLLSKQMKHRSPLSMPLPQEQANTDENFAACAHDAGPTITAVRLGLTHRFEAPVHKPFALDPQYAEFREIARVLAGAAEHYSRTGRPAVAMAILLDGVEMAAMIPHGDAVIGYLVAMAVQSICLYYVEALIPRLTSSELRAAGKRVEHILSERVQIGDIIRQEGQRTTESWMQTFRDPKNPMNPLSSDYYETNRWLVDDGGAFGDGLLIAQGQQPPSLPLSKKLQLARFSLADKESMLRENLAYYRMLAKECDDGPYQSTIRAHQPDNLLMQAEKGMMQKWRQMYAGDRAALAIVRTELALEEYRRARGRYPDRLSLLVTMWMSVVEDDPYAGTRGNPLVYRSSGDCRSYLLYSLGPDMTDNGGTSMGNFNSDSPGDIVAGKLYPARRIPVKSQKP